MEKHSKQQELISFFFPIDRCANRVKLMVNFPFKHFIQIKEEPKLSAKGKTLVFPYLENPSNSTRSSLSIDQAFTFLFHLEGVDWLEKRTRNNSFGCKKMELIKEEER